MKRVSSKNVIYKFKPDMEPVERIKAGETVVFEANDCWHQQVQSESDIVTEINQDILNPATGPLYVEGAEPGDLLKVHIDKIDFEDHGNSVTLPGGGLLGNQVKRPVVKILPVKDGYVYFDGLKLPQRPMIGVIGVAPSAEEGYWPTATPWKHGGNMDTINITEGTTLYFPVAAKGALLAMGDCHALMGDGEICFTGVETKADVTVTVDVVKNTPITWPLLETPDHLMVIASGADLDEASYNAASEAVDFMAAGLKMDRDDAYVLASLIMDLKISQVVDPKLTVRAAIPSSVLDIDTLLKALAEK